MLPNKVTLNIGCGERVYDTYPNPEYKCINFDERKLLERVDAVGDVRDLSRWDDEVFNYILASDIIEHFPIKETESILLEWKRVLKVDGVIEFRLPNLADICRRYMEGKHDAKHTSWLLYGGQDYPGNFHYVAFDGDWFKAVVEPLGFKEVYFKEEGNNFVAKFEKVRKGDQLENN